MRGREVPVRGRRRELELGEELPEAAGRQLRAAGDELQQPRHLLGREAGHDRPEPLERLEELRRRPAHDVVVLEVGDAVVARAAHQQLQQDQGCRGVSQRASGSPTVQEETIQLTGVRQVTLDRRQMRRVPAELSYIRHTEHLRSSNKKEGFVCRTDVSCIIVRSPRSHGSYARRGLEPRSMSGHACAPHCERVKQERTSSSYSSKMLSRLSGMSSLSPLRKLSVSSRTLLASLYCASASR